MELFGRETVSRRPFSVFVDPSAFAHESCTEGAIRVRGVVFQSTLVVDNDTTVHDVHT